MLLFIQNKWNQAEIYGYFNQEFLLISNRIYSILYTQLLIYYIFTILECNIRTVSANVWNKNESWFQ